MRGRGNLRARVSGAFGAIMMLLCAVPARGAELCSLKHPEGNAVCRKAPPTPKDSLKEFVIPAAPTPGDLEDTHIESETAPAAGGSNGADGPPGSAKPKPGTNTTPPR